jgi:hypothetical protein
VGAITDLEGASSPQIIVSAVVVSRLQSRAPPGLWSGGIMPAIADAARRWDHRVLGIPNVR